MNKHLLLGLLFILSHSMSAQFDSSVSQDFGIWTEVNVEKKINKKYKAVLSISNRFHENAKEFKTSFTEVEIERNLKMKFEALLKFRAHMAGDKKALRMSPVISKSFKLKPFRITYRLRSDIEYSLANSAKQGLESNLRNKLTLKWNRKKALFSFYLSSELFQPINDDFFYLGSNRNTIGTEFDVTKDLEISLEYFIQQDYNQKDPLREYIISIGITYSL